MISEMTWQDVKVILVSTAIAAAFTFAVSVLWLDSAGQEPGRTVVVQTPDSVWSCTEVPYD